ncbi:MAG: hypothetical protein WCG55_01405 [bacterium]
MTFKIDGKANLSQFRVETDTDQPKMIELIQCKTDYIANEIADRGFKPASRLDTMRLVAIHRDKAIPIYKIIIAFSEEETIVLLWNGRTTDVKKGPWKVCPAEMLEIAWFAVERK